MTQKKDDIKEKFQIYKPLPIKKIKKTKININEKQFEKLIWIFEVPHTKIKVMKESRRKKTC